MSAALLWLLLLGMVSATSGAPRAAPLPAPAPGLPLWRRSIYSAPSAFRAIAPTH